MEEKERDRERKKGRKEDANEKIKLSCLLLPS